MADFSIPITIQDEAKVPALLDALRWQWGPNVDAGGVETDKTSAELKAEFKARSEQSLKDVYKRYQEHLRSQAVIDDTIDIT